MDVSGLCNWTEREYLLCFLGIIMSWLSEDVEFDVPLIILNKHFDMGARISEVRSGLALWQSLAHRWYWKP